MVLLIGNYYGKPVFFVREKANNGHLILLGCTGAGKTTEVIKIMIELARQGITVLAFDTNNIFADSQIHPAYIGEFKKYLHEIDAYNDGIQIPLFTPLTFSDGENEKRVDTIDSVTEAFAKTFHFGVRQKSALRTAVEAVAENDLYRKSGISAISDMLGDIRTAKAIEVRERIAQITGHNIFVDGELFIKKGKINLVRISKFSDDTQKKTMEIISSFLWKYAAKEIFAKDGLYMVFDECQNMDLGKNGMIGKILVEGRRFNLNLLLSTQVLAQDAHITKLMTQAALILNFRPAKSELSAVVRLLCDKGKEDSWSILLSRLKTGEFVASGAIEYEGRLISEPLFVSARIEQQEPQEEGDTKPKVHVKGLN